MMLGATACTAVAPAPPPVRELTPAQDDSVEKPVGAISLRFAWPTEGSVQVLETVRKRGHTVEFSYTLALSPDGQQGFVIERRDYRCTSFDGGTMDAAVEDAFSAAGIGDAGTPRMRISAEGELNELLDMESRVIEPLLARALEAPGIPEEEKREIAESMRSPGARGLFEAPFLQLWAVWVGGWRIGEVVPGVPVARAQEAQAGSASPVKTRVTIEAKEPTIVDGRAQIRIVMDTIFDPESLTAAAFSLASPAMTARAQAQQREAAEKIGRLERVDHLEALTDPATLMPIKVLRRTEMTTYDKSGASIGTQKDQYLYVFTWPARPN